MKVFAYCDREFAWIVERAAGVAPLTSPPLATYDFGRFRNNQAIDGYDLLYLDFHYQGGECLGDGALCVPTILEADMRSAVVFTGACNIEVGPILPAFLASGAAVVGGTGTNYEYSKKLQGAHLLGMWFRRFYSVWPNVSVALNMAKARVFMGRGGGSIAAQDALKFKIWRP